MKYSYLSKHNVKKVNLQPRTKPIKTIPSIFELLRPTPVSCKQKSNPYSTPTPHPLFKVVFVQKPTCIIAMLSLTSLDKGGGNRAFIWRRFQFLPGWQEKIGIFAICLTRFSAGLSKDCFRYSLTFIPITSSYSLFFLVKLIKFIVSAYFFFLSNAK